MNIAKLNTVSLNVVPLNGIAELIRKRKPSGGGGTTPDVPAGYEVLMASDGAIEATDGVIYVLQ